MTKTNPNTHCASLISKWASSNWDWSNLDSNSSPPAAGWRILKGSDLETGALSHLLLPLLEKTYEWILPESKTPPGYTRIFACYISDVSFMVKKNMQTNTRRMLGVEIWTKIRGHCQVPWCLVAFCYFRKPRRALPFTQPLRSCSVLRGGWKQWWSHQGNHMESWLFAVHTFEENHCGTIHSSGQIVNRIPLNGGDFCIQ